MSCATASPQFFVNMNDSEFSTSLHSLLQVAQSVDQLDSSHDSLK